MTPAPDSQFLLQLLLAGVLVGNAIAVWLGIANRRSMQKREVTFSEIPASKIEFDRHVERNEVDHRDIFAKIGGVDRGTGRKISEEILIVHNRVNALEKSVGGLESSAAITNQRLIQIDAKIDRLIERD